MRDSVGAELRSEWSRQGCCPLSTPTRGRDSARGPGSRGIEKREEQVTDKPNRPVEELLNAAAREAAPIILESLEKAISEMAKVTATTLAKAADEELKAAGASRQERREKVEKFLLFLLAIEEWKITRLVFNRLETVIKEIDEKEREVEEQTREIERR